MRKSILFIGLLVFLGIANSQKVYSLNLMDTLPSSTITWDFQDGVMPTNFTLINDENTVEPTIAPLFPNAWNVRTYDGNNYVATSTSWFTENNPADRWMITPKITLNSGNYLQFDVRSQDLEFKESMEVRISTTNLDKSAFTTVLWSNDSIPNSFITETIDLSAYNGQNIYIAFILKSTHKFAASVDNIKFLGQVLGINTLETNNYSIYPNPASEQFTITGAQSSKVRVYDILGRIVLEENIVSNNQSITISNLNPGVYTIEVVKEEKSTTTKLIIK